MDRWIRSDDHLDPFSAGVEPRLMFSLLACFELIVDFKRRW